MRNNRVLTVVAAAGIGLVVMTAGNAARANYEDEQGLGAKWWQWALSIPANVNPLIGSDSDGYSDAGKCVVGQSGSVWFLAGAFFGGTAKRTCAIPDDKSLFFPVYNNVEINTPNICGQGGSLTVAQLREFAAANVDGVTAFSAELDHHPIHAIQRLQSPVFEVALPKDNIFNAPSLCAGTVPPGIYSPAVDDGYYVLLDPLRKGAHTLRIQAAGPNDFAFDVTYSLNVIHVSDQPTR